MRIAIYQCESWPTQVAANLDRLARAAAGAGEVPGGVSIPGHSGNC